jgi:hypothetical protein
MCSLALPRFLGAFVAYYVLKGGGCATCWLEEYMA